MIRRKERSFSIESDGDIHMNVIDEKYLGHDVIFEHKDWLIVFDGSYNFMLFNSGSKRSQYRYTMGWMPENNVPGGHRTQKGIEYYVSFESALKGLFYVFSGKKIGFKDGCIPSYETLDGYGKKNIDTEQ